MKAILEFDLDNQDDRLAHIRAIHATEMADALFEISYNLKKKILWKEIQSPEEAIETCFEMIWDILNERNINPDKLIL